MLLTLTDILNFSALLDENTFLDNRLISTTPNANIVAPFTISMGLKITNNVRLLGRVIGPPTNSSLYKILDLIDSSISGITRKSFIKSLLGIELSDEIIEERFVSTSPIWLKMLLDVIKLCA